MAEEDRKILNITNSEGESETDHPQGSSETDPSQGNSETDLSQGNSETAPAPDAVDKSSKEKLARDTSLALEHAFKARAKLQELYKNIKTLRQLIETSTGNVENNRHRISSINYQLNPENGERVITTEEREIITQEKDDLEKKVEEGITESKKLQDKLEEKLEEVSGVFGQAERAEDGFFNFKKKGLEGEFESVEDQLKPIQKEIKDHEKKRDNVYEDVDAIEFSNEDLRKFEDNKAMAKELVGELVKIREEEVNYYKNKIDRINEKNGILYNGEYGARGKGLDELKEAQNKLSNAESKVKEVKEKLKAIDPSEAALSSKVDRSGTLKRGVEDDVPKPKPKIRRRSLIDIIRGKGKPNVTDPNKRISMWKRLSRGSTSGEEESNRNSIVSSNSGVAPPVPPRPSRPSSPEFDENKQPKLKSAVNSVLGVEKAKNGFLRGLFERKRAKESAANMRQRPLPEPPKGDSTTPQDAGYMEVGKITPVYEIPVVHVDPEAPDPPPRPTDDGYETPAPISRRGSEESLYASQKEVETMLKTGSARRRHSDPGPMSAPDLPPDVPPRPSRPKDDGYETPAPGGVSRRGSEESLYASREEVAQMLKTGSAGRRHSDPGPTSSASDLPDAKESVYEIPGVQSEPDYQDIEEVLNGVARANSEPATTATEKVETPGPAISEEAMKKRGSLPRLPSPDIHGEPPSTTGGALVIVRRGLEASAPKPLSKSRPVALKKNREEGQNVLPAGKT